MRDHPKSPNDKRRPAGARPQGGKRGDEPLHQSRPRGDKPFKPERPRGERTFAKKPDGERAFKPRGDKPSRSERPHGERPFRPDRPRGDKPFRPEHPPGERSFKPRERDDHGERTLKPRGERPDHPRGDRAFRPGGNRPQHAGGPRPFKNKSRRPAARVRDGRAVLFGWHSVKAALENPARKIHRVLASENAARRLAEELVLQVTVEVAANDAIEALTGPQAVHQGIVAEADVLASPAIEDLVPTGLLLVLDQITDPHNVGAILRNAAAFGVEAIITTERHSPETTGVLAKAASGALEYVPIVTVVNLARALEVLKDKDVFLVGLDSTGERDLATVPLRGPLALVFGAEGKGLRQLTRTNCDVVARLDLPGRIKSLNVSNATALALHIASTRLRAEA